MFLLIVLLEMKLLFFIDCSFGNETVIFLLIFLLEMKQLCFIDCSFGNENKRLKDNY